MTHKGFLSEIERTMPVPVTSFPWQDPADAHLWAPEMEELLAFLKKKSQGSSAIFTGDGGRYSNPLTRAWRVAYHVLLFVVSSSEPDRAHIIRSRMVDVLEARFPGQDEFHGDVMACFGEAQHIVYTEEHDL